MIDLNGILVVLQSNGFDASGSSSYSSRVYGKDLVGTIGANNEVTIVEGTALTFDLTNFTINASANITGVNAHAIYGVIYVIDEVLLVP